MFQKINFSQQDERNYQDGFPLLITSALKPSAKYTALQDFELRLDATVQALNKWLAIGVKHIVICDGSGVDLEPFVCGKLLATESTIEFLHFVNDFKEVWLRGKGYGEGEIINFALDNSLLLKEFDYFAKCTGKLWVENYFQVARRFNGVFVADFYGRFSPNFIDTRFYIVSKHFYLNNLSESFKDVDDDKGYYLEHAFLDSIYKSGLKNWICTPSMRIVGLSGSSATFNKPLLTWHILRNFRNYFIKLMF